MKGGLYSTRYMKFIEFICYITSSSGVSSVIYDFKSNRFYVTKASRYRNLLYWVGLTAAVVYFCGRSVQIYFDPVLHSKFPLCYLILILPMLVWTIITIVTIDYGDFQSCMVQMFKYSELFFEKHIVAFCYKTAATGLLLEIGTFIMGVWTLIIVPVAVLVMLIVGKDIPLLPHTLLPPPWNTSLTVVGPAICLYFCSAAPCFTSVFGHCSALSTYYATVTPILRKEMRVGLSPSVYKTRESFRSAKNLPVEYRAIELIHKKGMRIYGLVIIPFHFLIGQFILYANFTLIRHRDDTDILLQLVILVLDITVVSFWSVCLEISGWFHSEVIKTMRSWKFIHFETKNEYKSFRKFKKSCLPIVIGYQKIVQIKRLTVLKFMRGIVKGTFRAVLLSTTRTK